MTDEPTSDPKHPKDNAASKKKASDRMRTPLGRLPTSYTYGNKYPAGWLFWKDAE